MKGHLKNAYPCQVGENLLSSLCVRKSLKFHNYLLRRAVFAALRSEPQLGLGSWISNLHLRLI